MRQSSTETALDELSIDGTRYATETHLAPGAWLEAVGKGNGESLRDSLSQEDAAAEYMMMGMRLSEGLDLVRFTQLSGVNLSESRLSDLVQMGMITISEQRLRATDQGRALLNAVLRELLMD
ncbi:hypothetical protein [Leisingera sp. F5]|uniref:hypothetical protein n=1 Tax=Leisingera sp. F5 TaxID=1813816 RepID=UPI000AF24099|nr:hypothetical protein [Leisingera sp. F5]